MEDIERDAAFENAKQSVLASIFGNTPAVDVPDVETRAVDFKFGRNICWMDQPRTTSNNDNTGWDEINRRTHANNHYHMLGQRFALAR